MYKVATEVGVGIYLDFEIFYLAWLKKIRAKEISFKSFISGTKHSIILSRLHPLGFILFTSFFLHIIQSIFISLKAGSEIQALENPAINHYRFPIHSPVINEEQMAFIQMSQFHLDIHSTYIH